MRTSILFIIFAFVTTISSQQLKAQDSLLHIIIVAGQSNALNWHADAQLLESSNLDNNIPFYYHTGLPPDRGFEIPFNATSDSVWARLSYQTQNPFVRYYANFFGPEMSLARELSAHVSNLAVFKSAYGGSNLASDWQKGANTGNQLYDQLLGQFNHATALLDSVGIGYKVVGLFWMQGESDAANSAYASMYEANLKKLIQNFRADVGNLELKVVLGRIGTHLPSPYVHKETVRAAQMNVAADDSFVRWVDTDDQLLDTDSIHLLADGVKILGQRMATAWLNLVATSLQDSRVGVGSDFLFHNFPNPFNPTTTIQFTLAKPEFVSVKIYNILGRELELLTQSNYASGMHSVVFNAQQYATGIYLYEVQIGNKRFQKLMSLIK